MQYFDQSLAEQTFAVTGSSLGREVDAAEPKLRAHSDACAASSVQRAKWSPKQILGHLIDSAANNHQRFVRVQAENNLSLPGYAQEFWVDTQRYNDRAWPELIDLWCSYNRHLAHVIAHIPEAKGHVNFQIGSGSPVTLRFVALDYVGHVQHHLGQNLQAALRTISMAENKTKPTSASVAEYLATRASNDQQSTDCQELMALFKKVTRHSPRMWGPSIVGYGSYKYTYESGRTGEAPLAGFAIRGREFVVYLSVEGEKQKALLRKVGKYKMGKVCFYFKQLADLDKSTLEKLVVGSIAEARQRYG